MTRRLRARGRNVEQSGPPQVCNNGLIAGALAIMGDDQSGAAASMLEQAVPNIRDNCAQGPSPDGTWSETPNYWYFGSTGHAQAALALLTATGSTQGLMDSNPGMQRSGLFHMAVTGAQGLFSYGDAGKFLRSLQAESSQGVTDIILKT